ncbi:peptidylprolyl isomerase fpr4 [Irineochytrium annulatum]|nr:peptidylprolyl isomerase fpr4 [Irineochytrium annulatum]
MHAGFWGLTCEPGNAYSQMVDSSFKLTNVALDHKVKGEGRGSLSVQYGKNDFVIANLLPGKVEQQVVDLAFIEGLLGGEEITFTVHGEHTLHLTGYHIAEDVDEDDDDDEDDEMDGISFDEDGNPVDEDGNILDLSGWQDDDDEDDEEEDGDEEEADNNIADLLGKRKGLTVGGKNVKKAKIVEIEDDDDMEEDVTPAPQKGKKEAKAEGKKETKAEKKAEKKTQEKKGKANGEKAEAVALESNVKTLPSGLKIEDVVVGSGPRAKNGKKVQVRYIGKLPNGKVFDSNTSGGKPFTFRLGAGEVIKGWDMGVNGMNVGGSRKMIIPPGLGYGSRGAPPDIPGNSTLHFEVKLLKVD